MHKFRDKLTRHPVSYTHLDVYKRQGKYVGGYAPYGYVLHPTIRNKLTVDPEAADVIRRIFREALEGSNTSQIARSLNAVSYTHLLSSIWNTRLR